MPRKGEHSSRQLAKRLAQEHNTRLDSKTVQQTAQLLNIQGSKRKASGLNGIFFGVKEQQLIEQHLSQNDQLAQPPNPDELNTRQIAEQLSLIHI